MTTPGSSVPLGPDMSDMSTGTFNFSEGISSKLQFPSTCTFNSYTGSQQSCLAYYSGLQQFFSYNGSSINLRFGMYPCQASSGNSNFLGPEILTDCYGQSCSLLTQVTPCTTDSDCSSYGDGVTCIDWLSDINPNFDFFYLVLTGNNAYAPLSDQCFGGKLSSDFDALLSSLTGSTMTTHMKFCSVNFTYLTSPSRNDGFNLTQWIDDQFIVSGKVAQNIYFQPWPDSGITTSTGSTLAACFIVGIIALFVLFPTC